jgi:uncharacterized protein YjbI with pentapeptide repeats
LARRAISDLVSPVNRRACRVADAENDQWSAKVVGRGLRARLRHAPVTMRPLIIIVTVLVAALVIVSLLALAANARPSSGLGQDLSGMDRDALETEKLRQEVLALEQENVAGSSLANAILSLAPFVAVIVGVFGLFATVWRQLDERDQQRRQLARETEREELRRFDQNFATVVENLGSNNAALQASAVVSLTFLLTPEYARYHERVLLLALATAKSGIGYNDAVGRLFVGTIEKALRVRPATSKREPPDEVLNLSRVRLDFINLSRLDLTGADIAFASLHHANLTEANLFRVRGYKVELADARLSRANLSEARLNSAIAPNAQFHGTNLVSARLEKAVLTGAQFYQARLQEAHLEGADLTGAAFEAANLNNAYLTDAKLDDSALRSIATGSQNWRKAHFDAPHLDRLRALGDQPQPTSDRSVPEARPEAEDEEG